jgi:hypothetical protein
VLAGLSEKEPQISVSSVPLKLGESSWPEIYTHMKPQSEGSKPARKTLNLRMRRDKDRK